MDGRSHARKTVDVVAGLNFWFSLRLEQNCDTSASMPHAEGGNYQPPRPRSAAVGPPQTTGTTLQPLAP